MARMAKRSDRTLNPDNPVVKLCAAGMQAEAEQRFADAARLFLEAWEARTDDFEGCVAAHYLARHQATPEDTFRWNRTSLELADAVGDDRVLGFYPSLHLNFGKSHETLGDRAAALRHYRLAEAGLEHLPAGPYGDLVRNGVRTALARMTEAG
jgi:hypothetical protein